jgi:hypothetical protein
VICTCRVSWYRVLGLVLVLVVVFIYLFIYLFFCSPSEKQVDASTCFSIYLYMLIFHVIFPPRQPSISLTWEAMMYGARTARAAAGTARAAAGAAGAAVVGGDLLIGTVLTGARTHTTVRGVMWWWVGIRSE